MKKLAMTQSLRMLIISGIFLSANAFSHNIVVDKPLPPFGITTQSGLNLDQGELKLEDQIITYHPWNTNMIKGKVSIIQAMAGRITTKKMNAPLMDAIITAGFSKNYYQTVTIVNHKDILWGTKGLVKSSLEDSKKEFPHSAAVLDGDGKAATSWQLEKGSSAIILVDKQGIVKFVKEGKLSEDEIKQLITRVRNLIPN